MGRTNLVGDTWLLGPKSLVDDMKDNATGSSTLEVQSLALEVEPICTLCAQQIQYEILNSGRRSSLEHKNHSEWMCSHDKKEMVNEFARNESQQII